MPEGDTIHRIANRLRPAIQGQELVGFSARRLVGRLPRPGETVDRVHAHGKHLLIDFSGGLTLRVHLRMTGSWQLYRAENPKARAARGALVSIEVPGWIAACFNAPDIEVGPTEVAQPDHLGPDLCDPDPDFAEVAARARKLHPQSRPIGELLMDQRVAAGIGNVYKSEVLWAEKMSPHAALGSLDDERLTAVFRTAHEQLRFNLDRPGERKTVAEGVAAYRRDGQPCRRCGEEIVRIMQGRDLPRSTYWCSGCQVDS